MLEEYAAWIGLDLAFQDFAEELAGLPGDYAPPGGALLVAATDVASGAPQTRLGMIALRRRSDTVCEMKRLYVRPSARGLGVAPALVDRVLEEARQRTYRTIVLDTLTMMTGAQRLYERLGFRDIPPYYDTPIAGTRFMGREL